MSKKIKISHYIEYLLTLIFLKLLKLVPISFLYPLAKGITNVVTLFVKPRSKVVLDNLTIAFPNMKKEEMEDIRYRMYVNIAMTSLESLKYLYLSNKDKIKFIEHDKGNIDDFKSSLSEKGGIVVGGHLGFFEGGGFLGAALGIKTSFVVANQKNKLTEKLIDIPREGNGIRVIHRKKDSARNILRAFRDGYCIAMLSDQDAGKIGDFVTFFGKKASTHKGAAVFALKFKLPIYFVDIRRDKKIKYKHKLNFIKIDFKDIEESNLDFDDKVKSLVQRYTNVLEDYIKLHPEEYWWVHKRYKTKEK
ncbi:MAG: hypothetical protein CR982_08170 [Candidatus Cloacimonadota bacterium]|nr:MAG: hypothetical protein CR982_08170 [Candidatus Cloacimonadota bacterium]PIE77653.1 MAG: hypothetical protein CSA15_12070 [Candidatus Delongbacteria bacterium]